MLSRQQVASLYEELLTNYHSVRVSEQEAVFQGKRQNIIISTVKVKGTKKQKTLIRYYEQFFVNSKTLLKGLSKECATK